MEHPYTKLLQEIDGAHYVRFQQERSLIYSWKGGTRVEVVNMEGACVGFFGVDDGATLDTVQQLIETHMQEDL